TFVLGESDVLLAERPRPERGRGRRRQHERDRGPERERVLPEAARAGPAHRGPDLSLDEDVKPRAVVGDVHGDAVRNAKVPRAPLQLTVEALDLLDVGERAGRLPDLFQRELHGSSRRPEKYSGSTPQRQRGAQRSSVPPGSRPSAFSTRRKRRKSPGSLGRLAVRRRHCRISMAGYA